MPNLCIIPSFALYLHSIGKITAVDIIVLCAIGEHTDRNGEGCWASARTLSEKSGVGRSTFFSSTGRLLQNNLIERESGKDEGRSSTYRIILDNRRVSSQQDGGESSQRDTPHPASEIPESSPEDTPTINAPSNAPMNATSPGLYWNDDATMLQYNHIPIMLAEHRDDWNELHRRIFKSRGDPRSFLAEMTMAAQGEHGYDKMPPLELGNVVRGFNANGADVSFRLFKAYLKNESSTGTKNGGRPKGHMLAASKLIQTVRKLRDKQFPNSLEKDWANGFTSPAVVQLIKDFGVHRFLADSRDDGTLTSQLAKAMGEAAL